MALQLPWCPSAKDTKGPIPASSGKAASTSHSRDLRVRHFATILHHQRNLAQITDGTLQPACGGQRKCQTPRYSHICYHWDMHAETYMQLLRIRFNNAAKHQISQHPTSPLWDSQAVCKAMQCCLAAVLGCEIRWEIFPEAWGCTNMTTLTGLQHVAGGAAS